jgi:hypothetical protein
MDELHDKHPRDWMKQACKPLVETTESYMVDVTGLVERR